ncbi:unnamed protein product [Clavelina lepadiformis]|uniref:Uncharacterized protein n=1 Tax=Clavelina lepadiformis TaxID=159417 RepID=A0ABP0F2C0_CLALP
MGCNISTEPVRVADCQEPVGNIKTDLEENGEMEKRVSTTKSHDSSFISLNGSIESDKITLYSGHEYFAPHRSKSIDLSRNGSANRDDPPVGAATIIIPPQNSSAPSRHSLKVPLPHQPDNVVNMQSVVHDITLTPPEDKNLLNRRRRSDGDVGKVTNVTCIPQSLLRAKTFNSSSSESRSRHTPFGPRNSRLTLTESQKDFFRMLDEKVAQGKDYSSEDDRSIASFKSMHRKDSGSSIGILVPPIPQQVR